MTAASSLVNKVWSFCHSLRDDGVSYGAYLEQLTYLIFLKMADEYARPPHNRDLGIPAGHDWPSLTSRAGAELERHYIESLLVLGQEKALLGQIFVKAQSRIQDPARLASSRSRASSPRFGSPAERERARARQEERMSPRLGRSRNGAARKSASRSP